jgi:outer membrane biosynthesis protein TonB
MLVCKYAGDKEDEYCANCNGCTMKVEGKEISCEECAGYEAGDIEADGMNEEPVEDVTPEVVEEKPKNSKKTTTKKSKKEDPKSKKEDPKPKKEEKVKVVEHEEKHEEVTDGIKVISLRYLSSATVKKDDNYFKFTAEEEWNVEALNDNSDIQDAREKLWAKLNSEIDTQIEDLQTMNS